MSSDNKEDIVRRVVGAFGSLSNPSNESWSADSSGSSAGPSYVDSQHKLHGRFGIPSASTASLSVSAKSSDRFIPYKKGKRRAQSHYKGCLVVTRPEWTKEMLVCQNITKMFGAWTNLGRRKC